MNGRRKAAVFLGLFFCFASMLNAFDIKIDMQGTLSPDLAYVNGLGGLYHEVGPFSFIAELGACNDGKYTAFEDGEFTYGFYYYLNNGGLIYDGDRLKLKMGRFVHSDVVDSPYSLFISSEEIPAVQLEISYEDDLFFYLDRWVQLNDRSALYAIINTQDLDGDGLLTEAEITADQIDRAMNFKSYGLKFGRLKVGFQDSTVYTRLFDAEYFFNPVPGWFLQYINTTGGKPWTKTGNDNSIMGFFGDWTDDSYEIIGQLLLDDFNLNSIMNPSGPQYPNKIAWSLGGRYDTKWGKFGLFHAGATKYTFEPYGTDTDLGYPTDLKYGYTYYPTTTYRLGEDADGDEVTLDYQDNYIGYKYGENNIALLTDWLGEVYGYRLYSSLEFTLSGSKSPANPNQEFFNWREGGFGTKMFNEGSLEKKIELDINASRTFGSWTPYVDLEIGGIFNVLKLESVPVRDVNGNDIIDPEELAAHANNATKIFHPSGDNELILNFTIGCTYTYSLD